ncbi:uncharacterized protein LOC117180172 isoform X2 [Belonocnema kinseyi]|nr:uncharacterized protein LOC117180172 isoform X2 [Belonocnema kinseyi]
MAGAPTSGYNLRSSRAGVRALDASSDEDENDGSDSEGDEDEFLVSDIENIEQESNDQFIKEQLILHRDAVCGGFLRNMV